jgi:hypothetical protein
MTKLSTYLCTATHSANKKTHHRKAVMGANFAIGSDTRQCHPPLPIFPTPYL